MTPVYKLLNSLQLFPCIITACSFTGPPASFFLKDEIVWTCLKVLSHVFTYLHICLPTFMCVCAVIPELEVITLAANFNQLKISIGNKASHNNSFCVVVFEMFSDTYHVLDLCFFTVNIPQFFQLIFKNRFLPLRLFKDLLPLCLTD